MLIQKGRKAFLWPWQTKLSVLLSLQERDHHLHCADRNITKDPRTSKSGPVRSANCVERLNTSCPHVVVQEEVIPCQRAEF